MNKPFDDRFKFYGEYKFDRFIFSTYFIVFVLVVVFFMYQHDWNLNYYECQEPKEGETLCLNPFYKPSTWENSEYLPVGKYGYNSIPLIKNIVLFCICGFILSLILNHIFHNKGKKLKFIELKI